MTEDIIKSIAEAEEKAAEIKERALAETEKISSAAEQKASEIEKSSEEVCKVYRETQLKAAQNEAEKQYRSTLEQKKKEAKNYADEVLENVSMQVNGIVGRITSGNS